MQRHASGSRWTISRTRHDSSRVLRVRAVVRLRVHVADRVRRAGLAMCSHCPPSVTGRKQSSGSGSRLLVMDCPTCPGMPLRAAFSSVARCGYPSCGSCGSVYVFRCPGEHLAYCDVREDDPNRHPVLADHAGRASGAVETIAVPAVRGVGVRWRCCDCAGFVAGEVSQCKRCRSNGPHELGEEHSTLGASGAVAERRARLRREHKRRSGHVGPRRPVASIAPDVSTDLPF